MAGLAILGVAMFAQHRLAARTAPPAEGDVIAERLVPAAKPPLATAPNKAATYRSKAVPNPTPEPAPARSSRGRVTVDAKTAVQLSRIEIDMFVRSACKPCDTARGWLVANHLTFVEHDVGESAEHAAAWRKLAPSGELPVFRAPDVLVVGLDLGALLRQLTDRATKLEPERELLTGQGERRGRGGRSRRR